MKNIILFLTFIISFLTFAQKENAIVNLKNGEKKSGLIKITSKGDLKFYENDISKGQIIETAKIERINYTNRESNESLYSVQVDKLGTHKLLQLVTKGKVSLYKNEIRNSNLSSMHTGGVNFENTTTVKYYVKRKGDIYATLIGYDGIIKNKAKIFFSDCDEFLTKINDKKFRRQNPKIIVDYYNENCKK